MTSQKEQDLAIFARNDTLEGDTDHKGGLLVRAEVYCERSKSGLGENVQ